MALWDPEFINYLKEIVKKPILIGLLLISLKIIDLIKDVVFPDHNPIVDLLILFGNFWILIIIIKYTIEMLIENYTSIRKKYLQNKKSLQ
jgi:hypothetical protein